MIIFDIRLSLQHAFGGLDRVADYIAEGLIFVFKILVRRNLVPVVAGLIVSTLCAVVFMM
ncbi:MAG: hypothetical protein U5L00_04540 [Desulfovermiculus sp.]|nr:hypothetical protein [Desulfovermiculus sp.]